MTDAFLTVAAPSEAVFREKMSRFLAFVEPVSSPEEAKRVIKEYANRFHDARHVCWAYTVGPERKDFLSSDNGEPSGTAGKPILGQINSFGLTDLVVVVVRYFGGIKLGTSGLIAAYREAARLALEEAEIVERHVAELIRFTFPYLSMNDVMRAIKQPLPIPGDSGRNPDSELRIISQQFDNACAMELSVRGAAAPALRARLTDIPGVCFR